MTDEQRFQADDRLKAESRAARADLSRHRQEARELGAFLEALGRALQEHPERMAISNTGARDADAGWFLLTRDLPTRDAVRALSAEIMRLNDLVGQLRQDLRDRGLED